MSENEHPDVLVWLNKSAAISVRYSEYPANSKQYGIDVRKYLSTKRYTGFTRKGIWVPIESKSGEPIAFKVAIGFIQCLAEAIEETPRQLAYAISEKFAEQVKLDERSASEKDDKASGNNQETEL